MLQRIANESADGKAATSRIQALQEKKAAELRAVYYHQGYGAATAKLKPLVAALRKEVEALRQQIQGKQS